MGRFVYEGYVRCRLLTAFFFAFAIVQSDATTFSFPTSTALAVNLSDSKSETLLWIMLTWCSNLAFFFFLSLPSPSGRLAAEIQSSEQKITVWFDKNIEP